MATDSPWRLGVLLSVIPTSPSAGTPRLGLATSAESQESLKGCPLLPCNPTLHLPYSSQHISILPVHVGLRVSFLHIPKHPFVGASSCMQGASSPWRGRAPASAGVRVGCPREQEVSGGHPSQGCT